MGPMNMRVDIGGRHGLDSRPSLLAVALCTSTHPTTVNSPQRRRQKKRQQQGPKVVAPAVEKAKGAAVPTATDAAETLALRFLALFFGVILVEGVLLAASGFLPDEADAFIERTLYKTFSPTVGVFLTCSSVYGLWKSRQGEGQ